MHYESDIDKNFPEGFKPDPLCLIKRMALHSLLFDENSEFAKDLKKAELEKSHDKNFRVPAHITLGDNDGTYTLHALQSIARYILQHPTNSMGMEKLGVYSDNPNAADHLKPHGRCDAICSELNKLIKCKDMQLSYNKEEGDDLYCITFVITPKFLAAFHHFEQSIRDDIYASATGKDPQNEHSTDRAVRALLEAKLNHILNPIDQSFSAKDNREKFSADLTHIIEEALLESGALAPHSKSYQRLKSKEAGTENFSEYNLGVIHAPVELQRFVNQANLMLNSTDGAQQVIDATLAFYDRMTLQLIGQSPGAHRRMF